MWKFCYKKYEVRLLEPITYVKFQILASNEDF